MANIINQIEQRAEHEPVLEKEKSTLLKDWIKDVEIRQEENLQAGRITGEDLETIITE